MLILALILAPLLGISLLKMRWSSRAGFESITTLTLRTSTEILDHEVGALFSLADDPNHKWLLQDSGGIRYLGADGFPSDGDLFSHCETLGDMWPALSEPFRSLRISTIIKGLGTGNEDLLLTPDQKVGVVYSFRT